MDPFGLQFAILCNHLGHQRHTIRAYQDFPELRMHFNQLKLFLRLFITLVFIRMVLDTQFPKCFLYLTIDLSSSTQNLIPVIFFFFVIPWLAVYLMDNQQQQNKQPSCVKCLLNFHEKWYSMNKVAEMWFVGVCSSMVVRCSCVVKTTRISTTAAFSAALLFSLYLQTICEWLMDIRVDDTYQYHQYLSHQPLPPPAVLSCLYVVFIRLL